MGHGDLFQGDTHSPTPSYDRLSVSFAPDSGSLPDQQGQQHQQQQGQHQQQEQQEGQQPPVVQQQPQPLTHPLQQPEYPARTELAVKRRTSNRKQPLFILIVL